MRHHATTVIAQHNDDTRVIMRGRLQHNDIIVAYLRVEDAGNFCRQKRMKACDDLRASRGYNELMINQSGCHTGLRVGKHVCTCVLNMFEPV